MARLIANFVLFQLGWFASVLSAAQGSPWMGVMAVVVILSLHLAVLGTRREGLLVAASALSGAVLDTLLVQTDMVVYASNVPLTWAAPVWIVGMWANFAITLRHSLAWLDGRPAVASGLGAVAGPLAYWGASGLGAVTLAAPVAATLALAVIWGAALPALFWLSSRVR